MILPERVFGSSGVKTMLAGFAIAPIFCGDVVAELLEHLDGAVVAALERDVGDDRLAGDGVGAAADGGLGDPGVVDERGLDLDRRDAMAGHVHHVVDAAEEPEVAVLVDPRAVAGEVEAGEALPVGRAEPRVVAEDPAGHRGPRPVEDEIAAALVDPLALLVDDPGGRRPGRAWWPSRASSS